MDIRNRLCVLLGRHQIGHCVPNRLLLFCSMASLSNGFRRALIGVSVGAATVLSLIFPAISASAAGTASPGTIYLPSCSSTQWRTAPAGGGSALSSFGPPGINGGNGDTITVVNECNVTVYINPGSLSPGSWIALAGNDTATYTIANGAASFGAYSTNNMSFSTIAVTGVSGTYIGPTNSSAASTPTPVLETLTLSLAASGAACTGGNPNGYSGTWMTLPKPEDCKQSGPNAKPGAKLLGWSPNANFPVDVAQNQVTKGWGAYDGPINGVRMIFIPAGKSTFVSGSNTLFPVWSA